MPQATSTLARGQLTTRDVQWIYFDAPQQRDTIMWPYATRCAGTSLASESDAFELAETVLVVRRAVT
jgi:hypothetical protein